VVVGRLYRRTPVFSDAIRYLVINPYWEIPHGIAVRDKLPLIREDPAYLSRQGIDVFEDWSPDASPIDAATVDWQSVDAESFSLRLRQRPGPANALGRIKFMFPNRFNVYLHDTPDRADFQLREREASSGCIRVEHALQLAAALLENREGWDREAIGTAVESGRVRTVVLDPPVPIHLLYFTAWVDEDGAVQFRRDLYGRDARLSEALFGDAAAGTG
jgi:murein L,D-transpeptidase YcbB/YkuD